MHKVGQLVGSGFDADHVLNNNEFPLALFTQHVEKSTPVHNHNLYSLRLSQ